MSQITTFAPARANSVTQAAPNPELPPLTKNVRPLICIGGCGYSFARKISCATKAASKGVRKFMSIAFLIVRIILGLSFMAHGTQKLFGWFEGGGITGTGDFFEGLGFRPGKAFAVMAAMCETLGGFLTLFGAGGALGPVLIVLVMLTAIGSGHITKGFFVANGGWELNSAYIAAAIALAYAGNGAYSVDGAMGLHFLTDPLQVTYAFAAAVIVAALNLFSRRRAPAIPETK
jgi:putative oxidoreductase